MGLDGSVITDAGRQSSANHLVGTGNFDECLRQTFPLLEKDIPCPDEPCLVHGVHVPAIDFDVNHFIGVSEYWHTTHEIFEMAHKDKSYDFNTYQSRVKEFCEQPWSTIQEGIISKTWGKKVDEKSAYEVCFKASWLINMLHDGVGIPRIGLEDTSMSSHNGTKEVIQSGKEIGFLDPFQAVNKIKSTEVSWTMGKMLLYASASIPPAHELDLPVGFGSNVPGIPEDFQYPSGGRVQSIPEQSAISPAPSSPPHSDQESQSITDQIHDTIFHSDAPHRLPGFLLFLLILVIAAFYLCGRDRRSKIYNSVLGSSRSSKSGSSSTFLSKIFPHRPRPGRYDQDIEEGATRLYDPNDFELGAMSSSSSDDGIDANDAFKPKSKPTSKLGSPRSSKRNLNVSGRLTPDVMDRRGLVVRTESRERLGGTINSRSGSPTRMLG
jgi:hypothetical protein